MLTEPVAWIGRDAIASNLQTLNRCVEPSAALCPVVKADAYGHGLDMIIDVVMASKPRMLAVATLQEAMELAVPDMPKLVFRPPLPDESFDVAALTEHCIRLTLWESRQAERLAAAAWKSGVKLPVHVKIDTGMGRMGVRYDGAAGLLSTLSKLSSLRLEGIYTHLATADELDSGFANQQLDRFDDLLGSHRFDAELIHAANSAAAITLPRSHYHMIRCGLATYGISPGPAADSVGVGLQPAMRLEAPLIAVKRLPAGQSIGYGCAYKTKRETIMGLVCVGYADGYLRGYSNKASMIYAGKAVPVIGRVSMDQTAIDLTDASRAEPGDTVVVIDDDPDSPASASALAQAGQTIPYETLSRLGPRIQRRRQQSSRP